MNLEGSIQQPTSVIFLGIDGVLIGDRGGFQLGKPIQNKVQELFERKKELGSGFTQLEWRIAASYFLSKTAVANLNSLIEKVSKIARVLIVISSAWKEDGTVEDLRTRMFSTHSFPKFIIDKTPSENDRLHRGISQSKYGFDLKNRGRQIDYWLRENYEKLNIKSFVIFDAFDEEMSERYPHHFIEVNYPLSESDVEKAYQIMSQLSFSSQDFPSESQVAELSKKKAAERKDCNAQ